MDKGVSGHRRSAQVGQAEAALEAGAKWNYVAAG